MTFWKKHFSFEAHSNVTF